MHRNRMKRALAQNMNDYADNGLFTIESVPNSMMNTYQSDG